MNKIDKDAIAIIGLGLRFPKGISNINQMFSSLMGNEDLITNIPDYRFAKERFTHNYEYTPGFSITNKAGVHGDFREFDAKFFNLNIKEATVLDPQQRFVLEMAYEALQSANLTQENIKGSNTAVFVGASSCDMSLYFSEDKEAFNPYSMTGSTLSIVSNRLSYQFDLHGPSLTVDTACSSSLVAVHQAAKCLLNHEADMAFCGGVNILLSPLPFVGFSQAHMLSADGKCQVFDENANGYVRSEGGAIILIKRLEDAIADNDNILAIIKASAINSDGKTQGIALPSEYMQEDLINSLYKKSKVKIEDLVYIEAHGTGTKVGDPIETTSIGKALGQKYYQKHQKPLKIGSVKSNLGHLETGSGMAGLVKAILILNQKTIPATIGIKNKNKAIDFNALKVDIVEQNTPIEIKDNAIIGINSFGFGGTNAHVILQEPFSSRKIAQKQKSSKKNEYFYISAKSQASLKALASLYLETLNEQNYSQILGSSIKYRDSFDHKLVIKGKRLEDFIENIKLFINDTKGDYIYQKGVDKVKKTALIFSGNGSQYLGMGKDLYEHNQIFKNTIDKIDTIFKSLGFNDLKENFIKGTYDIDKTSIAQPMLFALEVGIFEILKDKAIEFDALCGHSVGEVAASYASGALSLEQASYVIIYRSYYQEKSQNLGSMAAVKCDAAILKKLLVAYKDLCIGAYNTNDSFTISGNKEQLELLAKDIKKHKGVYKKLNLNYPFHSKYMQEYKEDILKSLSNIKAKKVNNFYSCVSGDKYLKALDNKYWYQNIRQPVKFSEAIDNMLKDGIDSFIEIGAHSILCSYIKNQSKEHGSFLIESALAKNENDIARTDKLDQIFLAKGFRINESKLIVNHDFTKDIALPLYPYDKKLYWPEKTAESFNLFSQKAISRYLGFKLAHSYGTYINVLNDKHLPELMGHKVNKRSVFPAAAFIEMVISAAMDNEYIAKDNYLSLENFSIEKMLFTDGPLQRLNLDLNKAFKFEIKARDYNTNLDYTSYVKGRVSFIPNANSSFNMPLLDSFVHFKGSEIYKKACSIDVEYTQEFNIIEDCYIKDDEIFLKLYDTDNQDVSLNIGALDGALQSIFALAINNDELFADKLYLPSFIQTINLFKVDKIKYVYAKLVKIADRSIVLDISVLNNQKQKIIDLKNVRYRYVNQQRAYDEFFESVLIQKNLHSQIVNTRAFIKLQSKKNQYDKLYDLYVLSCIVHNVHLFDKKGSADEIFNSLIDENCINYAQYLLDTLCAYDLAQKVGDGLYIVNKDHNLPEPEVFFDTLLKTSSHDSSRLLMILRIGANLSKILKGQMVFPRDLTLNKDGTYSNYLYNNLDFIYAKSAIYQNISSILKTGAAINVLDVNGDIFNSSSNLLELIKSYPFTFNYYVLSTNKADTLNTHDFLQKHENINILDENNLNDERYLGFFNIVILNNYLQEQLSLKNKLLSLSKLITPKGCFIGYEQNENICDLFIKGLLANTFALSQNENVISSFVSVDNLKNLIDSCFVKTFSISKYTYLYTLYPKAYNKKPLKAKARVTQNINALNENTHFIYKLTPKAIEGHNKDNRLDKLLVKLSAFKKVSLNIVYEYNNEPIAKSLYDLKCFIEKISSYKFVKRFIFKNPISISNGKIEYINPNTYALIYALRSIKNEDNKAFDEVIGTDQYSPDSLARIIAEQEYFNDDEVFYSNNNRYIYTVKKANFKFKHYQNFDNLDNYTAYLGSISANYKLHEKMAKHASAQKIDLLDHQRLVFSRAGVLDSLYYQSSSFDKLLDDEVLIENKASGLNFRDVMWASGLLPDEALENGFSGASLGLEASGVVIAVGKGVKNIKVNDRVLALASFSHANKIKTKASAVCKIPKHISHYQAAAIAVTFVTAYYAIVTVGKAKAGEKILIHGAAGGVGLAAIEIAKHLSLDIYATVGNKYKEQMLRAMGVEHIYSSRDLNFASQIMQDTNNQGIDLVLNSLYNKGALASLSILKPFGRFLELGKRDFYEDNLLYLRAFKDNLSYFGIDVDELMVYKPQLGKEIFGKIMEHFKRKDFYPLAFNVYTPANASQAFKDMRQGLHTGKIVIAQDLFDKSFAKEYKFANIKEKIHDCNVIITGATGGIAGELISQMNNYKVKSLTLISRQDKNNDKIQGILNSLKVKGAYIQDNRKNPEQFKQELYKTIKDLDNIILIHTSGALADGRYQDLKLEDYQLSFDSKVQGLVNILEVFDKYNIKALSEVYCSSVTTMFGNTYQSNYVAANSYLEALAINRSILGKNSLAIGFGPIADAGMLKDNPKLKDILENNLGTRAILIKDIIASILNSIGNYTNVSFVAIDFKKALKNINKSCSRFRYLSKLLDIVQEDNDCILEYILSLSKDKAIEELSRICQDSIAKLMGLGADSVNMSAKISELGMDSLMIMELISLLEQKLGVKIPPSLISATATILSLSESCYDILINNTSEDDLMLSALKRKHGME